MTSNPIFSISLDMPFESGQLLHPNGSDYESLPRRAVGGGYFSGEFFVNLRRDANGFGFKLLGGSEEGTQVDYSSSLSICLKFCTYFEFICCWEQERKANQYGEYTSWPRSFSILLLSKHTCVFFLACEILRWQFNGLKTEVLELKFCKYAPPALHTHTQKHT